MELNNKSLAFSILITKILFVVLAITAISAHWIAKIYDDSNIVFLGLESIYIPVMITIYAALLASVPALLSLWKLLMNIKRNIIFSSINVTMLRLISYCCFAEGIIFFIFGLCRSMSFAISAAALFFGLLMRVLKNVFSAAVSIKEENDFTV